MLSFDYGSPYFWDKVMLTKFISECPMVWYLICGTSWFYKSKTEKVTGGSKPAILPDWCCDCVLSITVHPMWYGDFLVGVMCSCLVWDFTWQASTFWQALKHWSKVYCKGRAPSMYNLLSSKQSFCRFIGCVVQKHEVLAPAPLLPNCPL